MSVATCNSSMRKLQAALRFLIRKGHPTRDTEEYRKTVRAEIQIEGKDHGLHRLSA
jgi:hypothetical protein